MTNHAEDMGLTTRVVDGIAHGLAIDGKTLVERAILRVPALQGAVEKARIDADKHIAERVRLGTS